MGLFNWKKIAVCALVFISCATFLKYSVDVCLPNYENSQVFPKALPAPQSLCSVVIQWDIYARTKNAEVAAKSNWYSSGPGMFETDEGRTGILVFGKDILKFTVLLSKFPAQTMAVMQLLTVIVVLSIIASLIWQWFDFLFRAPALPKVTKHEERARRLTAAQAILPDYLPGSDDHDRRR